MNERRLRDPAADAVGDGRVLEQRKASGARRARAIGIGLALRFLPALGLLPVFALAGCEANEASDDGGGSTDGARTLGAGRFTVVLADDAASFSLQRDGEALLSFPADAFVLGTAAALDPSQSYDPYWLELDDALFDPTIPDGVTFREATGFSLESVDGTRAVVRVEFAGVLTARLTIEATAEGRFAASLVPELSPGDVQVAFVRLRLRASADEGFYGLGEWPDAVNHRGKLRPMQLEPDLSLESSSLENHVPVPLLVGTRGWGIFVESRRPGLFDVARKSDDLVEITYGTAEDSAAGLRFHLFAADHPLDVQRHYFAIAGAPTLPAPWALGPWIWRDENRDQAEVLDDVRRIRELDLATSGLWIDRPYASAVNAFDFDPARFPDPAAMIEELHDAGLRVALWHTPYLEEGAEPYRSEALSRGFFPPEVGPQLNGWSAPIDLTNSDAYAFWQQAIRRYTALGVEGFKLDYAEDVVVGLGGARSGWRFSDGSTESTMHAGYTLLYHRVYAETLPATGGFLLGRAGVWGDQVHGTVIWPGDLDATLTRHREAFRDREGRTVQGVGGLPAALAMGLSLSASGFPFYGADTGGYRHSPPDEETFLRWTQQSALWPVMQVGDSSSQPPWVFTQENGRSEQTLAIYRTYARLHLRLFPLVWSHAQRLAETGRPIARPLGLAHPELGVHPDDTYLLGDELLVAPVVERGVRRRTVSLPAGGWIDWRDGALHDGGAAGAEVELEAPLAELPVLQRAGAIVPLLRPTIDTLAPATDPDVDSFENEPGRLWARVAPGPASSFPLWDGTVLSQEGATLAVTPGALFTQGVVFERLRTAEPAAVELDGVALARAASADEVPAAGGWTWSAAAGGTLTVAVPEGAHEITLR